MIGGDPSMLELCREEVRTHAETLSRGLIEVEADPANPAKIEPLMRAAHSIKGAARIVGIDLAVRLAHVMEDALVAAQRGAIQLTAADIDLLLRGSDVLATLAAITADTSAAWAATHAAAVEELEPRVAAVAAGKPLVAIAPRVSTVVEVMGTAALQPAPDFPPVPAFEAVPIAPDAVALSGEHSMLDLFREELRAHLRVLERGEVPASLEALKQIRGAALIVKCAPVGAVVPALAGFLSAVGEGRAELTPLARQWLAFTITTLARGISTDDETFAGWLTDATPASRDRVCSSPRTAANRNARANCDGKTRTGRRGGEALHPPPLWRNRRCRKRSFA